MQSFSTLICDLVCQQDLYLGNECFVYTTSVLEKKIVYYKIRRMEVSVKSPLNVGTL